MNESFGFCLVCAAHAVIAAMVYLGMADDCTRDGGVMVHGVGGFPVCVAAPAKAKP